MNNTNTLLIRRIIAIILLACTFIFLFAPDIISSPYGGGASFSEMREAETGNIGMYFKYANQDFRIFLMGLLGVLLNVCFFGIIALTVLGVVLMLLNKSKAATGWHTFLSFLTVVVFVIYIIFANESYGTAVLGPGAALFLLPIFSLAASILYKKDYGYSGAFPARAEQPQYQQPVPYQPAQYQPTQYQQPQYEQPQYQQPVSSGWKCPTCETQNSEDARFCNVCGTPQPESAPASAAFCPNCGAVQEPGASFCPNCGTKL